MTRIALPFLVTLMMVGLTRPALADRPLARAGKEKPATEKPATEKPGSDRVAKEKAAKKACATGDYQKGVDILADLFVDTNETIYVYNQGRCYQQNNRWEQAISRFREYLRKARDLSESERAETQRQIDDCQDSLNRATAVTPPPVTAPFPPPATTTTTAPPPPPPPEVRKAPLPREDHKGLRVAGIVVAAVGVAIVGTGVGLALKANSLSTTEYSRSREDERSSLKTWSFVSYGVGAAAIATGAILYIVGWPRQPTSSVALVPVFAPGGASLSLEGRF